MGAAIRVSVAHERLATPRVHRWMLPQETAELSTLICNPASSSILHYQNCGGFEWFDAKYAVREKEDLNRLWFHVLTQERARAGTEELRRLYIDAFTIPRECLE